MAYVFKKGDRVRRKYEHHTSNWRNACRNLGLDPAGIFVVDYVYGDILECKGIDFRGDISYFDLAEPRSYNLDVYL
jgi:hypothetical protein